MTSTILTQDKLKELLTYNPDTGVFVNKVFRGLRAMPGATAGSLNTNGYIGITINKQKYVAHRLAWFYIYGVWPTYYIDHINRIKTDNRIANLRDIPQLQNGQNKSLHKNNTSGRTGVVWHKREQHWRARIRVKGKDIYLGSFDNIQAAIECRKQAELIYHPYRVN